MIYVYIFNSSETDYFIRIVDMIYWVIFFFFLGLFLFLSQEKCVEILQKNYMGLIFYRWMCKYKNVNNWQIQNLEMLIRSSIFIIVFWLDLNNLGC